MVIEPFNIFGYGNSPTKEDIRKSIMGYYTQYPHPTTYNNDPMKTHTDNVDRMFDFMDGTDPMAYYGLRGSTPIDGDVVGGSQPPTLEEIAKKTYDMFLKQNANSSQKPPVAPPESGEGVGDGKPPKRSFWGSPQSFMDIDVNAAGFMLGQSLKFDPTMANDGYEKQAKWGNVARGVGAAGKLFTANAGNIAAGMGYQNRLNEAWNSYNEEQRKAMVGRYRFEEGGKVENRNQSPFRIVSNPQPQGIFPSYSYKNYSEPPMYYKPNEEEMQRMRPTDRGREFLSDAEIKALTRHIVEYEGHPVGSKPILVNKEKTPTTTYGLKYLYEDDGSVRAVTFDDILDRDSADRYYANYLNHAVRKPIEEQYPSFNKLTSDTKLAIIDGTYNYGINGVLSSDSSPNFNRLMKQLEEEGYSEELDRAIRNAADWAARDPKTKKLLGGGERRLEARVDKGIYSEFMKDRGNLAQAGKDSGQTIFAEGGEANRVVEMEGGEYYTEPGENVEKVEGRKHAQGGELMDVEEGTEVISDKLTIGKDNAKEIQENFGIKVKASMTYADVVDKFEKTLKIKSIEEELAKITKKVEKQQDVRDENTKDFNLMYLEAKAQELLDQLEQKKAELTEFSEHIYEIQEESKGERTSSKKYEDGGQVPFDLETIAAVAYEFGVPLERAMELMGIERYDKGGEVGGKKTKEEQQREKDLALLKALTELNGVHLNDDGKAKLVEKYATHPAFAYGDVNSTGELWRRYAKMRGVDITDKDVSTLSNLNALAGRLQGDIIEKNRGLGVDAGIRAATTQQGFQHGLDDGVFTKENLGETLFNKIYKDGKAVSGTHGLDLTDEENAKIRGIVNGLEGEQREKYAIANFNDKMAYYRFPAVEDIVYTNKEEYEQALKEADLGQGVRFSGKEGLYYRPSLYQTRGFETQEDLDAYIEARKDNLAPLGEGFYRDEDGSDVFVNPYLIEAVETGDGTEKDNTTGGGDKDDKTTDSDDDKGDRGLDFSHLARGNTQGDHIFLPNQMQYVRPPSPMMPHLKVERIYDRLAHETLTNEEQLKEAYRTQMLGMDSLAGLEDTQKIAGTASMTASMQEAINQSEAQVAAMNLQQRMAVQQGNTAIQKAEEDARAVDMMDYERRAYMAFDNTEKEIDGYLEMLRKIRMGDFNTRHGLNTYASLTPNYYVDAYGNVRFDPTASAQLYANLVKEEDERKKREAKKTPTAPTATSKITS